MTETIRVQKTNGEWLTVDCKILEPGIIYVPTFNGTWSISETGMVGNIGGNDWRIYDLHSEDCKRLCNKGGAS